MLKQGAIARTVRNIPQDSLRMPPSGLDIDIILRG